MNILFVLHETGRTMSSIQIARKLFESNIQNKVIFLVVGQAAEKVLSGIQRHDLLYHATILRYDDFNFTSAEINHLEDHPLTSYQLDIIKKSLSSLSVDTLFIASPSWLNARAPFQIAEMLADMATPETAFIYDGDFYKEEGCVYWATLDKPDTLEHAWRKNFTWLASLPGSKNLVQNFNPPLSVEVVGDPSIDHAIHSTPISQSERTALRRELHVLDNQVLLIVAGSKNFNDDIHMVSTLLENPRANDFQIRIILHPGAKNRDQHIAGYLDLFQQRHVNNIKMVTKESHSTNYVINSHRTREMIAAVADRLCSTIPGTQATQAAIDGIPVYCHLTQHISYLPADRIDTGPTGLLNFLDKDRTRRPKLTKTNLGLPLPATADIVSEMIVSKKKSRNMTPSPILFVCHDTGNTTVLLKSGNDLLKKNPDVPIKFLIIGTAAESIFNKEENAFLKPNTLKLTDWLEEKDFRKLNQRPLTPVELTKVANELNALQPVASITGCSCGPDALAPFQIIKLLTQQLNHPDYNFLYNGDFFQDITNNAFWTCLSEPWIEKISLFVVFLTAMKQTLALNNKVNCYLAGSTALDSVLESTHQPGDLESIYATLDVKPAQRLLFIAGSKFVEDDLLLLSSMMTGLKSHPETAVRMGMHPGTENTMDYIAKIIRWLDNEKIHSIKFLIKESNAAELTEQMRNNDMIKITNLTGDQIFPAVHALASSQPSTLATQAILKNIPSFCLDKYKHLSYMHAFFARSEELFDARNITQTLDKVTLGLPAERTVDIIGEALLAANRKNRPS